MKDLKDSSEDLKKYHTEMNECKILTDYLEQISSASYSLKSCEEILLRNDILVSCQALNEMETVMNLLTKDNHGIVNSGVVYSMLKREAKILRSRFTSRLRRLLNDFIQISRGRILVTNSLTGIIRSENILLSSELLLDDVWTALVLMNESNLEEIVKNLLQEVWTAVIFPLWREKKPLTPRINTSTSARSNISGSETINPTAEYVIEFTSSADITMTPLNDLDNGLILSLVPTRIDPHDSLLSRLSPSPLLDYSHITCRMKFSHLLEQIEQIFGFLYKHLFRTNEEVSLPSLCLSLDLPLVDHLIDRINLSSKCLINCHCCSTLPPLWQHAFDHLEGHLALLDPKS
jgi:hypothetical protein